MEWVQQKSNEFWIHETDFFYYHYLGPASPIIEDIEPLSDGLDISWKSDVTSRQEKYVVVYVRNDTGRPTNIETTEPRIRYEKPKFSLQHF
jgi:hypothetical protein